MSAATFLCARAFGLHKCAEIAQNVVTRAPRVLFEFPTDDFSIENNWSALFSAQLETWLKDNDINATVQKQGPQSKSQSDIQVRFSASSSSSSSQRTADVLFEVGLQAPGWRRNDHKKENQNALNVRNWYKKGGTGIPVFGVELYVAKIAGIGSDGESV